ncbi:putative oxidoreductase [Halomonadaceae bacterium LMG 33818]|uniref:aldo/keto reductase n=1 Tax=Cernens ardua TaxID=3402176 RepID=UPI003EDC749E
MSATLEFAGHQLPAIGQGTWHMGDGIYPAEDEVNALRLGLDLGLTLIDTAEMYGNGRSEDIVGRALKGRRNDAYLVSKVLPSNASLKDVKRACERSLSYLNTDYLDMYLLHWRGGTPLEETIQGFEELKQEGKIREWGVSNFDSDDINDLITAEGGDHCKTNQVLYNLGSRGIEFDLRPQLRKLNIPVMAYCPVAQGGSYSRHLLNNETVQDIASELGISSTQLLLAWAIRPVEGKRDVVAIPKAVNPSHIRENAKALEVDLTSEQLQRLNEAFPPPNRRVPLDIV